MPDISFSIEHFFLKLKPKPKSKIETPNKEMLILLIVSCFIIIFLENIN